MKTIVDKITGKEYFATSVKIELEDYQIEIDELRTEIMEDPYFDFKTRTFYDNVINK